MSFKVIVLCAAAFMVQSVVGQRQGSSCGCTSITVSDNGGPLTVTSVGPITPSGIALATELGLSGILDITGTLPYLSAVAFEGQYPTSGSTPVNYGCGDTVAINQEIGNPNGNAASISGLSSSSINSCGCRRN